jgi:hypothetical protein
MPPEDENRNNGLTDEEIAVLKRVIEREVAISWLGNSVKWIAGWAIAVFGAWALFSKAIVDFIEWFVK